MRRTLLSVLATAALLVGPGATAASAGESSSPSPSPSTSSGTATDLEKISAYTQPSIVFVSIEWSGYVYDKYNKMYLNTDDAGTPQPFSLSFRCTGYVVSPDGYIATAGHCVDPSDVAEQFHAAAAQWALQTGYYAADNLTMTDVLGFDDYVVQNSDAKPRKLDQKVTAAWSVTAGGVETSQAKPARVVKWQPIDKGDAAILKVEADDLNALPLAEDSTDIGTEIVAIGYPGKVDDVTDASWTPSFKEGTVSSTKTIGGGLLTVYEVSAGMSPGMSGGPVVNTNGEVVGFTSFGADENTENFNFMYPVDQVRELMADVGTNNELSEDSQAYRTGLDAYFSGDKATAVKNLQAVVDAQPTNDYANDYLDKANDLPNPAPKVEESGGSGLIIGIVVGLVVLALLAGLLFYLLSRGRKNKQTSTPTAPAPAPQYAGVGAPMGPGGYPSAPVGYQGQPTGYQGAPLGFQGQPVTPTAQPSQTVPTAQAAPTATMSAGPSAPPPPPTAVMQPAPSGPPAAAPAAPPGNSGDLFCPNCGQKHAPGQKFCPHCGTAL